MLSDGLNLFGLKFENVNDYSCFILFQGITVPLFKTPAYTSSISCENKLVMSIWKIHVCY